MRTVTIHDLIAHFGSRRIMAQALGISYVCVGAWVQRGGVSELATYKIEKATFGKYKADTIVLTKTKRPRAGG